MKKPFRKRGHASMGNTVNSFNMYGGSHAKDGVNSSANENPMDSRIGSTPNPFKRRHLT